MKGSGSDGGSGGGSEYCEDEGGRLCVGIILLIIEV